MNIFVLNKDPVKSAQLQKDRHVIKMCLESCQLLCNCFDQDKVPYKRTHYNSLEKKAQAQRLRMNFPLDNL